MTTDHIISSYASIRKERKSRMERFRDWYWASDNAKAMTASALCGLVLGVAFIVSICINY